MPISLRLVVVPRAALALLLLSALAAMAIGLVPIVGGPSSTYAAGELPPTGPAGNGLIAFVNEGDIWVAAPDGTDRRQLTSGPATDETPLWSRDGTRLAYWSVSESGGPSSLIVMAPDGSSPVTVATDEAGRTSVTPDWSPDGSTIAFTLCDEPVCDLMLAATDGAGARRLIDPVQDAWRLTWSPDGEQLAFGGIVAGDQLGLNLIAPDGSGVRRISRVTGQPPNFASPSWSPDGTQIATHAGPDDPDIWVIAADGSSELNLTEGDRASGFLPVWSPDGQRLAFKDDATSKVAVMAASGGDVSLLGLNELSGTLWSPDGTSVIAQQRFPEGDGIVVIDAANGDVLATIGDAGDPSWQRVAMTS